MNARQEALKTILWAMIGVLAVLTAARFLRGLGATTALTDAAPWGFWIAFDVMAGVALAAGGFVLAATVYIFGRQEYRYFVRPAILTALLGYAAVAAALLYDLGLPWRIWRPIIHQQHQSVLFEVAMCVMLYLAVLVLEFAPAILEHSWFDRPAFRAVHRLLKGAIVPLAIAGIVLSTLHQSSLGALFLITPYRLHPLWYSPIIWILFFVSAAGLGLMVVAAESFFSAWLFGRKLRMDLLSGLGRAACAVLFVYFGLRLGDLAARGLLGAAFDGSRQSLLFWFEVSISALVPGILLLWRRVRSSAAGLAACAGMTVFGMVGYRLDVCLTAFLRPEGMPYFPTWMEFGVSLGIAAASALVFIFFVEKLKIYPEQRGEKPDEAFTETESSTCDPAAVRACPPESLSAPRRYSLAAVIAAALTIAFLPDTVWSGRRLPRSPVSAPRTLDGWMLERDGPPGHDLSIASRETPAPKGARSLPLLVLDGNRDGQFVLFPHDHHTRKMGGQNSCRACHHQNMPFDTNTSCCECHRDMYVSTDIFDHRSHIEKLDGNDGCAGCHQDPAEVKSRESAAACAKCHGNMAAEGSFVASPASGLKGFAPGYMDAMHGLCTACHRKKSKENPDEHRADLAECSACHRDPDAIPFHRMQPYLASGAQR